VQDAHIFHGVEDAAVYRLEPVPHVRQGAGDDDAHGVIEVRAFHFVFDFNRLDVSDCHENTFLMNTKRPWKSGSSVT